MATWTKVIEIAPGVEVTITATDTGGGVEFHMEVTKGFADLNGFFLDGVNASNNLSGVDYGDSDITESGKFATQTKATFDDGKLDSFNNMNGSGESFDGGIQFGSAGIGKDDISDVKFTISGLTLADLEGLDFGIRATSVGATADSREGSVKTTGEFPPPDPDPEDIPDHFPEWGDPDISHVTFYFETGTDPYFVGDVDGLLDPNNNKVNDPDGWFTFKFDLAANPLTEISNDLDDWFDDALAYIADLYPTLDTTTLQGVAIKGGQTETWYDLDNDPDDDDVAPIALVQNKQVDDDQNWVIEDNLFQVVESKDDPTVI